MSESRIMSVLSLLYLSLAILGFGSAFALNKIAVEYFSPIQVSALRAVIATLAMTGFVLLVKIKIPVSVRHLLIYFFLGTLTVALPFIAIAWSQSYIDSALGGVIFASMPLCTLLLAPVFLKNNFPTGKQLLGSFIGMAGVAVAATEGKLSPDATLLIGGGMTMFAVICYTLGGIFVKRYDDIDPRAMTFGQLAIAMITLCIVAAFTDGVSNFPTVSAPYIALVVLGIFCTAVPMTSIFLLITREGPASASLTSFFVPFVAIGIGAVLMSESLPLSLIGGCIMVVGGAWLVLQKQVVPKDITATENVDQKA